MKWYRWSWTRVLATAVDVMFATAIWREYDITISSQCGLQLRKPDPAWWAQWLGWVLNHIQKNHCELAIKDDIQRADAALSILRGEPS